MVADFPLAYDERTYSERCVMDCTPKIDGGGEADFAEQSAERRSKSEVLCLGGRSPLAGGVAATGFRSEARKTYLW